MTVAQTFLVFDDLESFEECWSGTLSDIPQWGLIDVFLIIKLGLRVTGRKSTGRGTFPSRPIKGAAASRTHGCCVGLDHPAEVVLLGFSIPLSSLSFLEGVSKHSPHGGEGSLLHLREG